MSFNLADYEPVEDRIRKFWDDHKEGQIVTDLLPAPDGEFIVFASVWRDRAERGRPDATGLAREVIGDGNVNRSSALENCETSAIGRALANLGYAAKGARPSREEMTKVEAPGSASSGGFHPAQTDHPCPHCGSKVYDNRAENYGTKKPLWKCSNKQCGGGKNGYSWASWDDDPFLDETPVREEFDEVPLEAYEEAPF